jgi:putative toxin-antitoxin system antitoxin component (TIGR02293 family)
MAQARAGVEARKLVTLLGGRKAFPHTVSEPGDVQEAIRRGLPYATFEALMRLLGIRAQELARLLGVASRTLARRKDEGELSPIESDRLYRIAHIALKACEVLGTLEKARAWLYRKNRALGGSTPISCLDTGVGERQVEELLDRIGHGIYS